MDKLKECLGELEKKFPRPTPSGETATALPHVEQNLSSIFLHGDVFDNAGHPEAPEPEASNQPIVRRPRSPGIELALNAMERRDLHQSGDCHISENADLGTRTVSDFTSKSAVVIKTSIPQTAIQENIINPEMVSGDGGNSDSIICPTDTNNIRPNQPTKRHDIKVAKVADAENQTDVGRAHHAKSVDYLQSLLSRQALEMASVLDQNEMLRQENRRLVKLYLDRSLGKENSNASDGLQFQNMKSAALSLQESLRTISMVEQGLCAFIQSLGVKDALSFGLPLSKLTEDAESALKTTVEWLTNCTTAPTLMSPTFVGNLSTIILRAAMILKTLGTISLKGEAHAVSHDVEKELIRAELADARAEKAKLLAEVEAMKSAARLRESNSKNPAPKSSRNHISTQTDNIVPMAMSTELTKADKQGDDAILLKAAEVQLRNAEQESTSLKSHVQCLETTISKWKEENDALRGVISDFNTKRGHDRDKEIIMLKKDLSAEQASSAKLRDVICSLRSKIASLARSPDNVCTVSAHQNIAEISSKLAEESKKISELSVLNKVLKSTMIDREKEIENLTKRLKSLHDTTVQLSEKLKAALQTAADDAARWSESTLTLQEDRDNLCRKMQEYRLSFARACTMHAEMSDGSNNVKTPSGESDMCPFDDLFFDMSSKLKSFKERLLVMQLKLDSKDVECGVHATRTAELESLLSERVSEMQNAFSMVTDLKRKTEQLEADLLKESEMRSFAETKLKKFASNATTVAPKLYRGPATSPGRYPLSVFPFESKAASRAIIGWATGEGSELPPAPQTFLENEEFITHLHEFLKENVHNDPVWQAHAAAQKVGHLNISDDRVFTPWGRVPDPEDIFGTVELRDGTIVPGSYQPMPTHRLVSSNGVFQLPDGLRNRFIDFLKQV